jgi:UPF0755 protein
MKKNIILVTISIIILSVVVFSQAPASFPNKPFSFPVYKGNSLNKITDDLYSKNIIKSKLLFKASSTLFSFGSGLKAGYYKFTVKENVFVIAYRMTKGQIRQQKIRITIPEGTNVSDMAFILLKNLPDFNAPRFVSLAKKDEGYLYPDTYDFYEGTSPEDIISTMKDNFDSKIKSLDSEIKSSKRSLADIITMASLIEEEVNNDIDRKIVSGILWKRLDENMLLQVDAPFYYITDKAGGVTYDDLKIDSPYNTYKYKGLPKGPISNPGIKSIEAALRPTKTNYYYYLSDKDGVTRYANTYDGHLRNKNIYLK